MRHRFIAAIAGLVAAASPCAAEDLGRFTDGQPARMGASVAAYLRIPFAVSASERTRPHLGMRMSFVHSQPGSAFGLGRVDRADVVDLRITGLPAPTLLVAGRPVAGPGRPLHALGTAGTVGVVAGGAAALLLVGVLAWGGGFPDTCPTINGQRDHCINP